MGKLVSVLLSIIIMMSVVISTPTVAAAEESDTLPFVFEDTDYGVEDDSVTAKKISIKDKDAKFILPGEYSDFNRCCFLVEKQISNNERIYYLISKHGLVKSFKTDCSDDHPIEIRSTKNTSGADNSGHFPYDLYTILNPETDKYDLYNATLNKYYSYEADSIMAITDEMNRVYPEAFSRGADYALGFLTIEKDGKYGLLKNSGELFHKAEFSKITGYKNCLAGKTESGYILMDYDGKNTQSFNCVDLAVDYNVVFGAIYDEDILCRSIIDVDSLKEFPGRYDEVHLYYYKNQYRYFASKRGIYIREDYEFDKYYMITNKETVVLNEKFNCDEIALIYTLSNNKTLIDVRMFSATGYHNSFYLSYDYDTVYKITPDGTIIRTETPEEMRRFKCYCNGCFVYSIPGEYDKYSVEDKDGKIIATLNRFIYNNNNVLIEYDSSNDSHYQTVFSCTENKTIASNVIWKTEYETENQSFKIISDESGEKLGIIDCVRGTFSGFYDAKDFDIEKFSRVSIDNVAISENSDKYLIELFIEDDSHNREIVIINSDFKIVDVGCRLKYIDFRDTEPMFISSGGDVHVKYFNGKMYSELKDARYANDNEVFVTSKGYDEGLVSKSGDVILWTSYRIVAPVKNGVSFFCKWDGVSGLVNSEGEILVNAQFDTHEKYWGTANDSCVMLTNEDDVYIYDFGNTDSTQVDYSDVHKDFAAGETSFTGESGYYYKDSYFNDSATKYNHSLATMSLCMAFSTCGVGDYSKYDKNVRKIMKQCGFAQDKRYMQFHFNEEPTTHSIGCAIGSKQIDGSTLIAVAVRSGGYESEWANNFNMGRSGDHTGFDESANMVKDYILSYIQDVQIKGDVKIWITGYSRGAAVATQTAAKLNKLGTFSYDIDGEYYTVNTDKSRIFAYGFATPAGAYKDSDPHSAQYNNIFSVIEFNDIVPLLAPSYLGFDRYGTTNILPYRECFGSNEYADYINRIKAKMGDEYRVEEFKNSNPKDLSTSIPIQKSESLPGTDMLGTFSRKLVNDVAKAIGTRDRFVDWFQYPITDKLMHKYMDDSDTPWYYFYDAITKSLPGYLIGHSFQALQAYDNRDLLAETHANPKYYVYWMQLMDENYPGNLKLVWGKKNYRVAKIKCPVDVNVYDNSDTLVAEIKDDKSVELENGIASGVDENEQKVVYLPADKDYSIQIEAREDCTVSYSIEEFNAEFGEITRTVSFKSVPMKKSETMNAEVASYSDEEVEQGTVDGSNAEYSLVKQSENVEVDYDAKGIEEVSKYIYTVSVKYNTEEGVVYGGGQLAKGDYVRLQAVPNSDYEFDGFYIDGAKLENEDAGVDAVRFRVDSNVEVEAKFKQKPRLTKPTEQSSDSKDSITKKNNPIKVTVKTKTVNLKKLKKKAQKVNAITVKSAKGKVAYKITSASKKIKKLVKISSKGVITINRWKKAKKGTYSIKVKITAKGNANYLAKSVKKSVKVKVK